MAVWITLFVILILALVGWRLLAIRGLEAIAYRIRSAEELEPYVKSWGQWLDQRGRIVVRDPTRTVEAEFRKRRYKARPDALDFRYRNADAMRASFGAVRARFDKHQVAYHLELTPKRQHPRALTVRLDPEAIFTPAAAARLAWLAFGEPLPELLVSCEGNLRPRSDALAVKLIPSTRAERMGFSVGKAFRGWSGRGDAV